MSEMSAQCKDTQNCSKYFFWAVFLPIDCDDSKVFSRRLLSFQKSTDDAAITSWWRPWNSNGVTDTTFVIFVKTPSRNKRHHWDVITARNRFVLSILCTHSTWARSKISFTFKLIVLLGVTEWRGVWIWFDQFCQKGHATGSRNQYLQARDLTDTWYLDLFFWSFTTRSP